MGFFTWMFADNLSKRLDMGEKGYLACPDGTFYCASLYEGQGEFGGVDAYEMVVDWNKNFIVEQYKLLKENKDSFLKDKDRFTINLIAKFIEFELDEERMDYELENDNGGPIPEWKRYIGIGIVDDENDGNILLPYPIKITSTMCVKYNELPPSVSASI